MPTDTIRCANPWHKTSPRRAATPCAECNPESASLLTAWLLAKLQEINHEAEVVEVHPPDTALLSMRYGTRVANVAIMLTDD